MHCGMRWELEAPLTSGVCMLRGRVLDHLIGTYGSTTHCTVLALDDFSERLGPAPAEKSKAPRRSALTAAMTMPTMAPVLSPCGEVLAGADVDEDVPCAEEEGRTEDAGLPDGSGDSAGNGSPGLSIKEESIASVRCLSML